MPPPSSMSARFAPGEPIAIVGMACRFPGADDIEAFWCLLESGVNAVVEGDPGSGVGRAGQLFSDADVGRGCRYAGFLDRLDEFDAAFFRISPVEAQRLDPQQRMMLEVSWQALEDAGIDPERLRGSRTGVYAGISNYDYRELVLGAEPPPEPAACLYSVTGTSFNTAIGRVAFALGLHGPAMALDTACSSSLVAIHQAVSGLQRGEADLALAGGVHAILSARLFEMRANAGMLSPDGRCATFDAGANGYVRGEGCGILVLKRLGEAEADGDRIWAVIRSTAVNQDGATPGLTVPSAEAQERCIEDALSRAGFQPSDVDYVEAHGTGTEVGDPIEARATAAAYGRGRAADRPVLIGSVKTNIGHLEAAAGVAGVIKAVLSIGRRTIPKQLHFHNPSPAIDWDRIPLRVVGEPMEWPRRAGRPPRAGVSGFGWSGTNAHVLLEGREMADGVSGDGDPELPTVAGWAGSAGRRCGTGRDAPAGAGEGRARRPHDACPAALRQLRRGAPRAGGTLSDLDGPERRARAGRKRRSRPAACGHGLDRGRGAQPLRPPGGRCVTGRRVTSRGPARGRRGGREDLRRAGRPSWRFCTADRPVSGPGWARGCTRASRWCAPCSTGATTCSGTSAAARSST